MIIAAKNDKEELVYEVSDLVYHTLVLLVEQGVTLEEVTAELAKREGKISKTEDRKEITDL